MKREKIIPFIKAVFKGLFPSLRTYINFTLIFVFFLMMLALGNRSNHTDFDLAALLISMVGCIYCFNEWWKEVFKKNE